MHRALVLALLMAVGASARAHAEGPRLESVSWLIGCWEFLSSGQNQSQLVQESWGAPTGNSMLGMSRTVREGKVIELESIILRVEKNTLAYEAHPSGQPTATFLSTSVSDKSVIFENPKHDFPQKIAYQRDGDRALLAWIEGTVDGKVRRREFSYHRVVCSER